MGYNTRHDYGYGICIDDIKEEISLVRLMKLISTAPKLYKKVTKYIDEYLDGQLMEVDEILTEYVEACSDINYGGLAEILYEVILENEGIELYVCTDYNGKEYLLYTPLYPWDYKKLSENELNLSEESLSAIYGKYVCIVTKQVIPVEYQSVENGGSKIKLTEKDLPGAYHRLEEIDSELKLEYEQCGETCWASQLECEYERLYEDICDCEESLA